MYNDNPDLALLTITLIIAAILVLTGLFLNKIYKKDLKTQSDPSLIIHETKDLLLSVCAELQEAEDKITIAYKIQNNGRLYHAIKDIKECQQTLHELATQVLPSTFTSTQSTVAVQMSKKEDWEYGRH